ncbi:MAG TPA: hypothetical protein VF676_09870 [Flavobacterium sp.]|jgi:hypothetical protein
MNVKTIIFFLLSCLFATAQVKTSTILPIKVVEPKAPDLPAAIKEYTLQFKGFDFKIIDDAEDNQGNHMLIGKVIEIGTAPEDQDPFVANALKASLGVIRYHDVILSTDRNYKPRDIFSMNGAAVVKYDQGLQKFIVGCDNYIYKMIDDQLVTYYQPLLLVVNEKLQGKKYAVPGENTYKLLNFSRHGNLIHLFTRSIGKTDENINNNKIEIITVNTETDNEQQSAKGLSTLKSLHTIKSAYNENVSLQMSGISSLGNALYFLTSSIDPKESVYINHLYKFENQNLEEQPFDNASQTFNKVNWYNTNGFNVQAETGYFMAISKSTGSDITFLKADSNLNVNKKLHITTHGFTDNAKAIELPSGMIVLASIGIGKLWKYTVYDAELNVVKQIDALLPENSYELQQLIACKGGLVKAVFNSFDGPDKTSVIIQEIHLMK